MDPVSGMLLGGAALGGLNSVLGIGASAADAALQYHFAKKMYQHRYRWAMNDMKKAGLNPVLAANGGSVAGMGSAPSTDFAGALQNGVNSGLSAARQVSDMQAQQVTNAKTEADTKSVNQDVVTKTIKNKYLEPQEEAFTKDAIARAANNTALATLNASRSQFAQSLARSEELEARNRSYKVGWDERKSYYDQDRAWRDPEHNLLPFERKDLYLREKNARILRDQLAPLWQGVNSASRVMMLGR